MIAGDSFCCYHLLIAINLWGPRWEAAILSLFCCAAAFGIDLVTTLLLSCAKDCVTFWLAEAAQLTDSMDPTITSDIVLSISSVRCCDNIVFSFAGYCIWVSVVRIQYQCALEIVVHQLFSRSPCFCLFLFFSRNFLFQITSPPLTSSTGFSQAGIR